MINKRIFLAVFSLLLSSHQQLLFAYGLEPTPSSIDQDVEGERGGSKASSFTIPRVDVIGSQNNLLKIPSSAQLVNDEDLQSSHASTSNEALRKVPGIHVRDEEGLGTRLNIGIRGLNPTRSTKVLLLEDGIPVTFSPYGDNGSYYHPLIERYERIEVLKGMAQIAHGPQTASGVINYITPNPPQKFGASIGATVGNRDYLNTHMSVGGNHMQLDYTHKQGDGARDNIDTNIEDINFKGVVGINDDQAITLRANYFDEDSSLTYSGLTTAEYENFGARYNPFKNDTFDAKRYGVSLTHDWQLSDNALLLTNAYYSHFERDWWRQGNTSNQTDCGNAFRNKRLAGLAVDVDTECKFGRGRLREYDTFGVEPRLKVTHGLGELEVSARAHFEHQQRREITTTNGVTHTGNLTENNRRETDAYSGFVANRFDIGDVSITPAVRYEHIENTRKNKLNGASGEVTVHQWIPGLGVNYNPNPNISFFAGVHRGFTPPRTEDLIDNASGGSVDVAPETSTNYELGFRAKPAAWLKLDATAFRNDFKKLTAVGQIALANLNLAQGEALFQGVELATQIDLDNGFYSRGAFTWLPVAEQTTAFVQVVNGNNIAGSAAGNRQPYAPKQTATLSLGYKKMGWDAQIEAVHVGEQYGDFAETKTADASGRAGLIDNYTVFNAAISYRYTPKKTTFFITSKNLFDKTYIVDRARGIVAGSPRLVQAGIKVDF